MPTPKVLKQVSIDAQAAGLSVEPVAVAGNQPCVSKKLLNIQGKLCAVHLLTKSSSLSSGSLSKYLHLVLSLSRLRRCQYVIVVQRTLYCKRTMVVPSRELAKCFDKNQPRKSFYIRANGQATYPNRKKPCVDFLAYQDAWHLLKNKA